MELINENKQPLPSLNDVVAAFNLKHVVSLGTYDGPIGEVLGYVCYSDKKLGKKGIVTCDVFVIDPGKYRDSDFTQKAKDICNQEGIKVDEHFVVIHARI